MKCAQSVFLIDEAVKRVFISNVLWITDNSQISSSVLFMATCASPEQMHAALEELSIPNLEAESREGQADDTWVSSECQSALGVGRAVDSRIDQVCQERQTPVAPGSSIVIYIANLLVIFREPP